MTTASIIVPESGPGSAPESAPESALEPPSSSSLPPRSNFAMTWTDYFRPVTFAFWAMHLVAIGGVFYVGFSLRGLALAIGIYFARMFVVTAAYHRYFSHRSFKTSRWFQFVLALGAQSAAQKGVLWWASHHRWHHKYSDLEPDVHSAQLRGFWYSHIGWILSPHWNATDESRVSDLARYPELRFLNRGSISLLPAVALALLCYLVGGGLRPGLGLLRLDGDALARLVLDQLALAPVRPAALRDQRRLAQQLGAGDHHHRRGLAQQSPPLPELGQSGLPLVGDRRDLLSAAPDGAVRPDLGSAPPAGRVACRPPGSCRLCQNERVCTPARPRPASCTARA